MELYKTMEIQWKTSPLGNCPVDLLGAIEKEEPGNKVYLLDDLAIFSMLKFKCAGVEKTARTDGDRLFFTWRPSNGDGTEETMELKDIGESYLLLEANTEEMQYRFQGGEATVFCITAEL